jgi:hypothetical protein
MKTLPTHLPSRVHESKHKMNNKGPSYKKTKKKKNNSIFVNHQIAIFLNRQLVFYYSSDIKKTFRIRQNNAKNKKGGIFFSYFVCILHPAHFFSLQANEIFLLYSRVIQDSSFYLEFVEGSF